MIRIIGILSLVLFSIGCVTTPEVKANTTGNIIWQSDYKIDETNKKYNPAIYLNKDVYLIKGKLWSKKYLSRARYEQSEQYCSNMSTGNVKWRLPTVKEFKTLDKNIGLVNYPAKDWNSRYWSSSPENSHVKYNYNPNQRLAYKERFRQSDIKKSYDNFYFKAVCVSEYTYKKGGIEPLVAQLLKQQKISYEKLDLPNKPITKPYLTKPKLIKGEFETTSDFEFRQQLEKEKHDENKSIIDQQNINLVKEWKLEVDKLKQQKKQKIKSFNENKNANTLKAIEKAVHILYGSPSLKDVQYDADKELFTVEVTSQKISLSKPIRSVQGLNNALSKPMKTKGGRMILEAIYVFNNEMLLKIKSLTNLKGIKMNRFKANYVIYKDNLYLNESTELNAKTGLNIKKNDVIYLCIDRVEGSTFSIGDAFYSTGDTSIDKINFNPVIKSNSANLFQFDFHETVYIPVKLKYARKFKKMLTDKRFEPTIEFEIIDGKLKFQAITELKDPEYLVIEKEYKLSSSSSKKIRQFISTYPDSPFTDKAKTKLVTLIKQEKIESERLIRIANENKLAKERKVAEKAKKQRLAQIAKEKAEREFGMLGFCKTGSTVYHRERWKTTTSSGNIIADSLFGAATKEEFIVVYEGVVRGFVGEKVEVVINDYGVKQTSGGGFLQPETWRKYDIAKHADKYLGKTQFYDKSRCN